jgi:plasmid replication initiation protein
MKRKNSKIKFRGNIVKKGHVLNEGIYTLDSAEKYKLMLLMFAQISTKDKIPSSPEEISTQVYSFYVDDYIELKNLKDKYWFQKYVMEIIEYLKHKSAVTIVEEDSITTIWIFQKVQFKLDRKGLKIEYKFSYDIAEYLFELKEKFLAYHIKNIIPMRSKYAIRLYELLKQYEKIGERTFSIDEFREKIGTRVYIVNSQSKEKEILKDEYKAFIDLRRRVIEVAIREINKYADIEIVDVEYIKRGRGGKVQFITFKFKPKKEFSVESTEKISNEVEKLPKEIQKDKNEVLERNQHKPTTMETIWQNIGEIRKYYKEKLEEIFNYVNDIRSHGNKKFHTISENEILFLLINADREIYDDDLIVSIIKKALVNPKLENPMGFLIDIFKIDMKKAKFKELTLTSEKIDEKLFRKRLEEKFVDGVPALSYLRSYWNEEIKGKIPRERANLLKEPFKKAVYDEFENKVYIPVPDEIFKDWFEINFLDNLKRFLMEKFDIEDVEIEVLG